MKKIIAYILISVLTFGMGFTAYGAESNVIIDTSVPLFQDLKDGSSYTTPKELFIADLSKVSYILLKKEGTASVSFDGKTFKGYTKAGLEKTGFECVKYTKIGTVTQLGTYLLYARDIYDHATEVEFTITQTPVTPDPGGGGMGGGGALPPAERAAAPTASKESGTYTTGTAVTLTTKTEGATIYYTTDGTTPTKKATKYTGEIVIDKAMVLKAIAIKSGMDDSAVSSFTYVTGASEGSTPSAVQVAFKKDAKEVNYIKGYDDKTFKPEQGVTRAEVATMLSRLLDVTGNVTGAGFTDIEQYDWAMEAINICAGAGITKGYEDNTFRPSQMMTRAEFTAVLARILKIDSLPIIKENFSDMKGHWADQSVNAMYEKGYVEGFTDGTFGPEKVITRAQAVTIINRIVGIADSKSQEQLFTDVNENYWAYGAINGAVM